MAIISNEIFIVGAGVSMNGFNFERLGKKRTIAVNKSVKEVPDPTYFITADTGVARDVNQWTENVNTVKILCYTPTHKRFPLIREAFKNFDLIIKYSGGNPCPDIGFRFNEFQSGGNSGFCALQFAVIMGFSPIYLLGIDLTSHEGEIHRHDTQGANRKTLRWQKQLNIFYPFWVKGLRALKGTGREVYSCSPISRLNEYLRYIPIDTVVGEDNE